MKSILILAGVMCALILAGCNSELSENVDTSQLFFEFHVDQGVSSAFVSATFRKDSAHSNTIVRLSGGDTISVNGKSLGEHEDPLIRNLYTYETNVPLADPYSFRFERPGENPYISSVIPPAEPVLLDIPPNTTLAGPIVVNWTPGEGNAAERYFIYLESDCTTLNATVGGDQSSVTLMPAEVEGEEEPVDPASTLDSCNAIISVTAVNDGTMAGGLAGRGGIVAEAASTLQF